MNKRFLSFLLLLSFVCSVSAQKAQRAKPDLVEQNLRKHVDYLASDKLEGRRTGEKGATFAAGYLANRFANSKLKAGVVKNGQGSFLQPFPYQPRNEKGEISPDAKEVGAYNVIGILEGADPVLKNEAIVIGAHYDHLGRGGMGSLVANSTEIHHGADDNASGSSALIELARTFAISRKNKRTIIFVAFGGEEEGLLGSKYYVNNPVFSLDKTVAMINMDMVGRLKDDKLTIGGIGTASEWKGLVERINGTVIENQATLNAINLALFRKDLCCASVSFNEGRFVISGVVPKGTMVYFIQTAQENAKAPVENRLTESDSTRERKFSSPPKLPFVLQLNEDGFGPSDHSSFYGKQIPVLFFFTGTHPDYHKPSDTAEKINFEGLRKLTEFVRQVVEYIDQYMPTRPTYTVAKSSGTGEGRRGFSVSLGTIPSYSEGTDGILIDGVRDNSPASKTGLKAGDKIIRLAGKDVHNVQDYMAILAEMKPDIEFEVVVMRGTEKLTLKITPVARK